MAIFLRHEQLNRRIKRYRFWLKYHYLHCSTYTFEHEFALNWNSNWRLIYDKIQNRWVTQMWWIFFSHHIVEWCTFLEINIEKGNHFHFNMHNLCVFFFEFNVAQQPQNEFFFNLNQIIHTFHKISSINLQSLTLFGMHQVKSRFCFLFQLLFSFRTPANANM